MPIPTPTKEEKAAKKAADIAARKKYTADTLEKQNDKVEIVNGLRVRQCAKSDLKAFEALGFKAVKAEKPAKASTKDD
jgi:hypothetical protein